MAVKEVEPPPPPKGGPSTTYIQCDGIRTQTVGHAVEQDSDGLLKVYFWFYCFTQNICFVLGLEWWFVGPN